MPTPQAVIGRFQNNSNQDLIQVVGPGGAIITALPAKGYQPAKSPLNVLDFGATGTAQKSENAVSNTANNSITLTDGATFAAGDVGKTIWGTEPATGILRCPVGTITQVLSSTECIVSATLEGGDYSTLYVIWGYDDTAALQAANSAATESGSPIYIPAGGYIFSGKCFVGVSYEGDDVDSVTFFLSPNYDSSGLQDNHGLLSDDGGVIGGFTVDGGYAVLNFSPQVYGSLMVNADGAHFVHDLWVVNFGNTSYSGTLVNGIGTVTVGVQGVWRNVRTVNFNGGAYGIYISAYGSGSMEYCTCSNGTPFVIENCNEPFTGVVSCEDGSPTVNWVSGDEFPVGDAWSGVDILLNGVQYYVDAIVSTTQLTLTANYQGTTSDSVAYRATADTGSTLFIYGNLNDEDFIGEPAMSIINSTNVTICGAGLWGNDGCYPLHVDGTSDITLVGCWVGPFSYRPNAAALLIDAGGVVRAVNCNIRSTSGVAAVTNNGTFYDVGGNEIDGFSGSGLYVGAIQNQLVTPSSSSAAGIQGQIGIDANYIYVCTATNTWKRVALSSF